MKRIIMGPFVVLLFLISVTNRLHHCEAASLSGVDVPTTEEAAETTTNIIITDSGSVSNEAINIANITTDDNNPSSSPASVTTTTSITTTSTTTTTSTIAPSSELPPQESVAPVVVVEEPVVEQDNNKNETLVAPQPPHLGHHEEDDDDDDDDDDDEKDDDDDDDDDDDKRKKKIEKKKKKKHGDRSDIVRPDNTLTVTEVILDGKSVAQRSTNLSESNSTSTARPCPLFGHLGRNSLASNQGNGSKNDTLVVKELSPGTALEKISESIAGVMSTIKKSVTSIFSPGAGLRESARNDELECARNHSSSSNSSSSNSTLEITSLPDVAGVEVVNSMNSSVPVDSEVVEVSLPVNSEDGVVSLETTSSTTVLPPTNETVVSENSTTTTTTTTSTTVAPTSVEPEVKEVSNREGRKFKDKDSGSSGGGGGFFGRMGGFGGNNNNGGKKDKDKKDKKKNKFMFGF